jgi:hypothetical protein
MKVLLLLSMLSQGPDAPVLEPEAPLTPAHREERVKLRTCEKDLKDCADSGSISPKVLVLSVAIAVVSAAAIGFGAGVAWQKR